MDKHELFFYGNKTLDIPKLREVKKKYEAQLETGHLCAIREPESGEQKVGVCIMGAILLDAGVPQEDVMYADEDSLMYEYEDELRPYGFESMKDVHLLISINDGGPTTDRLLTHEEIDMAYSHDGEALSKALSDLVSKRLDRGLDKILKARVELDRKNKVTSTSEEA